MQIHVQTSCLHPHVVVFLRLLPHRKAMPLVLLSLNAEQQIQRGLDQILINFTSRRKLHAADPN